VRKAMGPVLTTGLALVVAAVIVANPVAPPVRDLQISTTQLSTSPEALIPFDKNLLKSISQPSASSNFNVALAQILGALAAEADRISTEVNSDVSTPMAPASATASQTPPVYAPLPADVPSWATPNGTPSASTTDVPLTVAASAPAIQQVVSDLTAETAYLGNQVVEAAYAAVNALADTPDVIVRAVWAVLVGDLATAFATIVQGIKAFINPGLILVGGVDEVVGQYVAPPINSTPSASAAAANNRRVAAPPAAAVGAAGESATDHPVTTAAEPGSGKPRQTKIAGSATRATTSIDQPQLTPRSSASAPSTGNSSHSAGPADIPQQPKPKTLGADNPGSASSGRSQNAGGRGASAGD
jgi:hypothetical protein